MLCTQYAICCGIPFLIPYLPMTGRLLLAGSSSALVTMGYYFAGWWGSRRVIRVMWQQSGLWILQRAEDAESLQRPWELLGRSWITPSLMVLRWRSDKSTALLLVLRSEMPATTWRQLQLRIKLEGTGLTTSSLTEV